MGNSTFPRSFPCSTALLLYSCGHRPQESGRQDLNLRPLDPQSVSWVIPSSVPTLTALDVATTYG